MTVALVALDLRRLPRPLLREQDVRRRGLDRGLRGRRLAGLVLDPDPVDAPGVSDRGLRRQRAAAAEAVVDRSAAAAEL
jgi:hypothetical protein